MNYLSLEEKRILECLYLEKTGYVRGIAKKLDLPPITVSRILRRHFKDNVLKEERRGNMREFYLNYSNFKTIGLACLIENERIENLNIKSVIKNTLLEINSLASFVVLYGSAIRGGSTKRSDIDILFISDKKREIIKLCRKISSLTGTDISPHVLTFSRFKKAIKEREAFVVNTVLEPKNRVFLIGIDYFLKLNL